jgi:hypothetical protein
MQADTCGYLEGEDQCDSSIITCGDSDRDGDSDDEQCGKIFNYIFSKYSLFLLIRMANKSFISYNKNL